VSKIFLGKPLHWLVLVVITAGLWYAGELRLHVIHFNAFILSVLAISAGCVLLVLYGPDRGGRLTRDEIVPDETELRWTAPDGQADEQVS
jgi:hypothetical protein